MKTHLYVLSEPEGPDRYVGKTRCSLARTDLIVGSFAAALIWGQA